MLNLVLHKWNLKIYSTGFNDIRQFTAGCCFFVVLSLMKGRFLGLTLPGDIVILLKRRFWDIRHYKL